MLPSNLLTVWRRKGSIQPRYAKSSKENLEVAKKLIEAYKHSLGKAKGVLKTVADDLEDQGYDYHFVRGLSLLLDRRSVFKCESQIGPLELRRKIFAETGRNGLAITPEKRRAIVEKISRQIGMSASQLEESFYADMENELFLQNFESISPQSLLQKYNLSLTQTLIFDSTELKFTVSTNWQSIFFKAKKLGLIYEAFKANGFWVKIDGPLSLFKLTRRYGVAMAKLLPAIIAGSKWEIEAKILWKFTNEIHTFNLMSWKHAPLFQVKPTTQSFDSFVEKDFANRFRVLNSKWRLKREPEPIVAGQFVIIPDFSFDREGIKLYFEVVGFWTNAYLTRKISKLKQINVRMLVAVDETLACERLAKLEKRQSLNVIYYKKKIPLPPILRYLQDAFKEVHSKQLSFLENLDVKFTESIVNFQEFAARTGTSVEAVRSILTERCPNNYVVLPDSLVRKDKLAKIKEELDLQTTKTGKLSLAEATRIAEMEHVDLTSAIQSLGYKIVWHGINAEKAEVLKNQK
jgi:predicted nuclease of restriction endonuclease-like RecB superfamily